jgi:hypothetical protein
MFKEEQSRLLLLPNTKGSLKWEEQLTQVPALPVRAPDSTTGEISPSDAEASPYNASRHAGYNATGTPNNQSIEPPMMCGPHLAVLEGSNVTACKP